MFPRRLGMQSPFRYFNGSPEIIWLIVMMDVRFPLSLRQVVDNAPMMRRSPWHSRPNLSIGVQN